MAIKLKIEGITVEVGTPEEAAELIRAMKKPTVVTSAHAADTSSGQSNVNFRQLVDGLSPGARRLVALLSAEPATIDDLAHKLGLGDARGIGPMIRACNARSQELAGRKLVISERREDHKATLRLEPTFAKAARGS